MAAAGPIVARLPVGSWRRLRRQLQLLACGSLAACATMGGSDPRSRPPTLEEVETRLRAAWSDFAQQRWNVVPPGAEFVGVGELACSDGKCEFKVLGRTREGVDFALEEQDSYWRDGNGTLFGVGVTAYDTQKMLPPDTPFQGRVLKLGPATLTGWMDWSGEILLYPSRRAMADVKADRKAGGDVGCISGLFENHYQRDFSRYDGKRVTITGVIVNLDSSPEVGEAWARALMADLAFHNWCWRDKVLLGKSIRLAP